MILADKIIELRKKNGWSQEQLAEKVNVTRQSVSKWEGAQSVPDLEKILQLAKVFGVSTDYLLKDELEETEYVDTVEAEVAVRRVSMEEANEFLRVKEVTSKKIALATLLCILSPICLMLLGVASELGVLGVSEDIAAGLGLIILFETEYGVAGMVKERQKQYRDTYTRSNILGTCLCILSVIPLFAAMMLSVDDMFAVVMMSLLFVMVGIGVYFFITVGIQWESMQKLLQEGEYSKPNKERKSAGSVVGPIYWPVVTAIYLAWSFLGSGWGYTWVIWPVAGVLYAALENIVGAIRNKK